MQGAVLAVLQVCRAAGQGPPRQAHSQGFNHSACAAHTPLRALHKGFYKVHASHSSGLSAAAQSPDRDTQFGREDRPGSQRGQPDLFY